MNPIIALDTEFSARFVMTLAHFLWQGAAIGLAVFVLGIVLRRASSRLRYGFFLVALLAMALCPPVTYSLLEPAAVASFAASMPGGQPNGLGQSEPPTAIGPLARTDPTDQIDQTDQTDRSDPSDLAAFAPANAPGDAPPAAAASPAGANPLNHTFSSAPVATDWQIYAPYLILAYLAGVLLMLARLALGLAGGGRLRNRADRITDHAILNALNRHAEQLKLRAIPVVAYCRRVAVPTVVGVIRPMILLPASLATGMPPQQVELLLLHELAHIRRYDHVINILQRLVEAALFFHPALWYLSHRIRVEREHCCDDLVIALGGERHAYVESLVAAAALATGARLSPAALAATGKPSQLRRRIHRLLGDPQPPIRLVRGGWVMTALAVAAVIAGASQIANLNSAESEREYFAQAESTPELETAKPVVPVDAKNEPAETRPEPSDVPVVEERTTETDSSVLDPTATAREAAANDSAQTGTQPGDESAGSALTPAEYTEELSDKYNELSSQMEDPDWWLRKVAVQQIGDLPYHQHFVFTLILALKDEDPRVQAAAAEGLAKQGDPDAVKHLVAALKEESQVREAAAEALTHFKPEEVMPLLTLAARDEEPQVFFGVIAALGKQNTADAATLLIEFFPKIWDESYYLAKGSGAPVRIPPRPQAAQQGLTFEPGPLGERLVTAFNDMDESIAEPTLLKAAQQPDWKTLSTAALIADKTGLRDRPAIQQALRRMLENPQDHARAAATLALGNALEDPATGHEALDKETADALVPVLHDSNLSVARIAATVLRLAQWNPDTPEDRAWYLVADGNCKEAAQLGSVAYEPLVHALHAAWLPTFLPPPTSSRNTDSPLDGIMSIEDPRKVEALIEAIKLHPEYTDRIAVMLGEIGDSRAVDVLLPMLDHLDGEIRQNAAWALGQFGDSRAVEPLMKLLNDSTGSVRRTVIQGLGRIGDPRAAVALRPLLDTDYRADAATALGEVGDEASVPKLLELYEEESPAYAKALAAIGGDRVRDGMIEILLQNTDENRRNGAAKVLGQLGDPAAIPALDDAIHFDTDGNVKTSACQALGSIGGEEAARVLGSIISDQNRGGLFPSLALPITEALSQIANPIASDALAEVFDRLPGQLLDPFVKARLLAATTLAQRGDPRARAMLEELRDIPQTRIEATNALQELEQSPPEAETTSPEPTAPSAVQPEESPQPVQPAAPVAPAIPDQPGQPEEPSVPVAPDPTDRSDPSDSTPQTSQLTGPRLQFRWVLEGPTLAAPTESEPDRTLAVADEMVLTEGDIASAKVQKDPNSEYFQVLFQTTEDGAKKLKAATEGNLSRKLAIVFDGRVLSAPVVRAPIGSAGAITGNLSEAEAKAIADTITSKRNAEQPNTTASPGSPSESTPPNQTDPSEQPDADAEQTSQLTGPRLQFRWVVEGDEGEGKTVLPAPTESEPDRTLAVGDEVIFYERHILQITNPNSNAFDVWFLMTEDSAKLLQDATVTNQGKRLAIILDGRVLSAPVVQAPISKTGQITRSLTKEEAEVIANAINKALGINIAEDLPVYRVEKITPVDERFLYDKLLPQTGESPQPEEPSAPVAPDRTDPTDQPAADTHQTSRLTGPRLQFRWVVDGDEAEGATVLPAPTESEPDRTLAVGDEVVLYEGGITNAVVQKNADTDHYEILFETNERWSERLMQATEQNKGKKLAIVFDGRILSAPIVQAPFGKSGTITGDFSKEEAEVIAKDISGAKGQGDDEPLPEPILYDANSFHEEEIRNRFQIDIVPEAKSPE